MSSRHPDVVIVVPGLIGSVLSKDGVPIWDAAPGAIWRLVANGSIDLLRLGGDDDGRDDLGDGVQATGLVSNVEVIPGLWKQGGYSRLAASLVQGSSLEPGHNYFEFAYDWRRDNRVSARRLATFALSRLARWKAESGNTDAKLVLICHSMGGLVARHFVECLDGWRTTRTIVSLGTPFRGSGNALGFLCNGFAWKVGPLTAFEGSAALRSFASVHQLLPIYPFVDGGGGRMERIADIDLPNLERRRVVMAMAFHDETRLAQEANAREEDYARHGTKVAVVVGTEQPTVQSASLDEGELTLLRSHGGRDHKGDGTVPRVSAIPLDGDDQSATFVPTTHSALQSDPTSAGHLRGLLAGTTIDLGAFRDVDRLGSIGLAVADMYDGRAPVDLVATTSDHVQTLTANLVRCDDGQSAPATMRRDGDAYRASIVLRPGAYWLTVSGRGLQSASDVFLVADF